VGNILIFSVERRLGCGFFCKDSENIRLENVTVHSCHGMGILAQTCHNITLDGFNTLRHGDQYYTANADATHFVNCTGLVTVENCTFEGQLDDALNIHGMYIRIEKIGNGEIFVREVHSQAKGIRVIREGDKVQVLHPKTLIPYAQKTVKVAEYINEDSIRLVFEEGNEGITETGHVLESLNRVADLIFRNNIVRHNRARGMLIATKGKVIIENNYFNTSGCAILFQSDGEFWFESGGVYDVEIRNNHFDACRYSPWGNAIIDCTPRPAEEEGKYFHKQIKSYREIVRQNEEEKLEKKIDSKLDPLWADLEELRQYIITVGDTEKKHMNVIISSYRYRLIQLCKQFINQGYITPAQYE
jgi:hypothetical protein